MTASKDSVSAPSPVPLAIARSMLALGIEASRAFCTASASAALPTTSPPPSLAATVIARASLVNSLPRRESTIAFLCLIPAHLLCPAMASILSSAAMRPGERAARAAAYERARPEILAHVPATARRVLDLGCATGTTGAALKARQETQVVGIELEPDYAREARTHLDRVFNTDAEQPPPELEGGFDVLIAA